MQAAADSAEPNLSFSSFLELYEAEVALCEMPARWVVEPLETYSYLFPVATSISMRRLNLN